MDNMEQEFIYTKEQIDLISKNLDLIFVSGGQQVVNLAVVFQTLNQAEVRQVSEIKEIKEEQKEG